MHACRPTTCAGQVGGVRDGWQCAGYRGGECCVSVALGRILEVLLAQRVNFRKIFILKKAAVSECCCYQRAACVRILVACVDAHVSLHSTVAKQGERVQGKTGSLCYFRNRMPVSPGDYIVPWEEYCSDSILICDGNIIVIAY